jgi:hypothetical protein
MQIIKVVFISLLLWCAGFQSVAQQQNSLSDRIEAAVASHEKDWQVRDKRVVPSMDFVGYDTIYVEWQAHMRLDVLIQIYSSEADAKAMFRKQPSELGPTLGGRMNRLDKQLRSLNTDNYIWESTSPNGRRGVVLRKGRAFAIVGAYSMKDASKLASYITKELQD